MKRILCTGSAGFLGSHFTRHVLETTDWHVTSLDRLDDAGNLGRLSELKYKYPERLWLLWHDLKAAIQPDALRGDFDYVVHMAAGSHVDRSVREPIQFIQDNVLGTGNLLEWVRAHQPRIKKVLYFSTDEVFGPAAEGQFFDEYARFNPENTYAATKAGGELLCIPYVHQHGLPICVTHCCNAYGPAQHREKFIPLAIERIGNGQLLQIHARDGVISSRLYIHVDDVSRAVMTVLEKGGLIHDASSGRYNIVAAEELSNLDVAQRIARRLGKPLIHELVENPPGRPKPDMRYALTGARLAALGWKPQVAFDDGLERLLA